MTGHGGFEMSVYTTLALKSQRRPAVSRASIASSAIEHNEFQLNDIYSSVWEVKRILYNRPIRVREIEQREFSRRRSVIVRQ